MTPAHGARERRWLVVILVILVVVGVGVLRVGRGTPAPVGAAPTPSALVGAPDAESSAWYCTGQSTTGGGSPGILVLTSTTTHPVTAGITVTTDSGAMAHTTAVVPARGVVVPTLPTTSSGSWQSETVITSGGGVAVTQTVDGVLGWSQAPCQSSTSASWYFASGTTAAADTLAVALLNPTSTPVVVDLSFVTPSGVVHPINYQGIVLPAGQMTVENVTSEVQEVDTISTVVTARTGRVVASEVQGIVGAGAAFGGLSLVPGVPAPQSQWAVPQAQEVSGGASEIDVFNPGSATETVTVQVQLPSGPLAPLTDRVLPDTTWVLQTSAETRIPDNQTYAATIDATGGTGVVVGRSIALPGTATPPPQAGVALAVDGLSSASPGAEWVVPPPGTDDTPAVPGAAPAYLALFNPSSTSETYDAFATTASGNRVVATGTLAARTSVVVSGSPLTAAGLAPILIHASGPMAVSEDASPSAGVGVVSMPGIPLAPAIGA